MIEIRNADVLKSGIRLLHGINWHIKEGEHWLVTGSNGSGKTTLLEMIAGIVHAPKGEIHYGFVEGKSWDERYAERKKKIHYVPAQAIQSLLHDRGLYYQQRYYGIGDEQVPLVRDVLGAKVHELGHLRIPESLSIDHLLPLEVNRLSNGQLKKVLFVKSLMHGIPKFLLLDYPFEGLDPNSRRDLCDFIDFLAATHGIQMILVSLDHELPKVMNRRLHMDDCHIVRREEFNQKTEKGDNPTIQRTSVVGITPVIEIRNLSIQYGEKIIIRDLNWTVNKGERWALVGNNGAGKTTLFSMIFADHPMGYSKDIHLFGRKRGTGESIWDIKRRINYIGPELISYLNPDGILLTARDYILTLNKRLPADRLTGLVTYFHGDHFFDKPVRALSSGQLQLMMLINCFLSDKELWLLDEPFQFLDAPQRQLVSRYLQSHLHSGTTLVLITHDEQDLITWTEKTMRI